MTEPLGTVSELRSSLDTGAVSSAELVDRALVRAAALEPRLHTLRATREEGARAEAAEADGRRARGAVRSPLDGIPIVLKDNLAHAGEKVGCASKILEGYRSPFDATAVERLREAGAVAVARTNMDEFAMGSSTENSAYGASRNPWDPERSPGGSSGGSAVAVAAGIVPAALGSDTGGSIRQPAAFTGVVGMKPTYGRVSRFGLVAFASSLDQIGPLARTVADCALVFSAVAGHDPRDATSLDAPAEGMPDPAAGDPAGLTVGVPRGLVDRVDADTAADFETTQARLRDLGVTLVDVALPDPEAMLAAYYVIATAEASTNLARFDGACYGARLPGDDYLETVGRTRAAGFGREVKRRILLGTFVLSEGYREAYYDRARRARDRIRGAYHRVLADCDAIATPTAPTAAFPLGARLDDPLSMYRGDVFTVGPSLAGLPALSVPTGRDRDGLPLSVQLTGRPLDEGTLFTLGAAVERGRGDPA